MWKMLKKMYPKISRAVPVGKQDRGGNIITNHESLKHLYLDTYIKRLRNRPISRVTSGVGIPTFSRYTDRLGKLAGILLL